MESTDTLFDDRQPADKLPPDLADMRAQRDELDAILGRLRDMEADRKTQQNIDPKKNPAQLPKADFDARILPNKEGGSAPNYTLTAVTETTGGFIVDADVLIGNVEHLALASGVDAIAEDYDTTSTSTRCSPTRRSRRARTSPQWNSAGWNGFRR